MTGFTFALYDAFSERAFGGSQAGIVFGAEPIDNSTRLKIAREMGWPATCFVSFVSPDVISARFFSTKREYPMCGHGTVCLATMMVDHGLLDWDDDGTIAIQLDLSDTQIAVDVERLENGRPLVMLDIPLSTHNPVSSDPGELMDYLGVSGGDLVDHLPVETVTGSFSHLVVPINRLETVRQINPDFEGLKKFCEQSGIDTVTVFCLEAESRGYDFHLRDFCPAVGVRESAAAGTTNGALASYLVRHGLFDDEGSGKIKLRAEQGLEMGRPSTIYSVVSLNNGKMERIQVGGLATKIFEGLLNYDNN